MSQTRKRALSSINVSKDLASQAKKDFMKRKLAVKALQAKLDKQTLGVKKPSIMVVADTKKKESDTLLAMNYTTLNVGGGAAAA